MAQLWQQVLISNLAGKVFMCQCVCMFIDLPPLEGICDRLWDNGPFAAKSTIEMQVIIGTVVKLYLHSLVGVSKHTMVPYLTPVGIQKPG